MQRIPKRLARLLTVAVVLTGCSDPAPPSGPSGVTHLLPRLVTREGGPVERERATLAGVGREAAILPGGGSASAPVDVPRAGVLRFAVASRGQGPCRATLRALDPDGPRVLWTADVSGLRLWTPVITDLADYAGRTADLEFSVEGDDAARVLWGSPVVTGERDTRRNLLLYEIDTLRADLLEAYGFPGPSSPRLGALARTGTLFASCQATASWTRPSAASILTSRSAPALGMTAERSLLPDDMATLTGLLRDRGWYTVAFQTNPNAGRAAGLDRDFDVVFEMAGLLDARERRLADWKGVSALSTGTTSGSTELIAFALEELLPGWKDLPLFLYIHVMDPHAPYRPRAPFGSVPGLPEATGNARFPKPFLAYSGDVRAGDHFLGEILRGLEEAAILPRTVQVFVSDHGEEFGDHGGRGHGRNLFAETLRVPWLIAGHPDIPAGRIVQQRVTTLDLLPTVLELLDVPPPPGLEGESVLPLLRAGGSGNPFPETEAFAHVVRMKTRIDKEAMQDPGLIGHIAVFRGPWKLVMEDYGAGGAVRNRLYDLRDDPGEQTDRSAEHPELAGELQRRARDWWAMHAEGAPGPGSGDEEIDPELQDQLRALGYVE